MSTEMRTVIFIFNVFLINFSVESKSIFQAEENIVRFLTEWPIVCPSCAI